MLLQCVDLAPARSRIAALWNQTFLCYPELRSVVEACFAPNIDEEKSMQFLLDCSTLPEVILLWQQQWDWTMDKLFYLTRSYCYSVHKARLRILGKWQKF